MAITKDMLTHWWFHYAKLLCLPEELEKFYELIDKFGEQKVFDFITVSYTTSRGNDNSPSILLTSIRHGVVEALFADLPDVSLMDSKTRALWNGTQQLLFKQISETYKHAA